MADLDESLEKQLQAMYGAEKVNKILYNEFFLPANGCPVTGCAIDLIVDKIYRIGFGEDKVDRKVNEMELSLARRLREDREKLCRV